ncbi:diguanylate phosphodiesterase (plasmid) [Burkholderia sp. PAMC 28687]|uniref:EAL domain-containing protein n=1 Tax=Burkholderiaceae TaxID=119060 RepID=UPI000784284F|nr:MULTISPECIES: EAL domain-containing protein [Burkholderiaceae]AMM18476.1 diguanylate phosphodiesterase [Burkholderia sp. PAMC 28687]
MSTHFNSIKVNHVNEGKSGCVGCAEKSTSTPAIDYAFQPIVDLSDSTIYGYEALVRGVNGEPAHTVLSQVDDTNRYPFDQLCRTTAIARAAQLGLDAYLSINFMPNAVYRPEACIRSTFEAAQKYDFPIDRIIFETIEGENIIDRPHLVSIFREYKKFGFQTAIDDFGAGYSGLTLLVDFQPDLIKLDMAMIRGIDTDSVRQCIVRGILTICRDLGISVIAEGIETRGERDFLSASGVTLMQGYFFAKPGFQSMPQVRLDAFAP